MVGGAYSPEGRGLFPQGPCWTKPISYPAWAGGSALRVSQGTVGKFLWTNQFPNYSLQPEEGEVGEQSELA